MTSKFLSFFRKYIQPSMVKLISSNKAEESALSSSSSSGGYDNYVTAVLTDQEYYIGPPQRGYFEFFTKTQFPFRLFNPQIITLPPGLNPTPIQEVPLPGQCQQNQECIQKWRFFTDITTACTLTGSYQVSFNQNCFNWGNKVCQNNQQFAPSVSITVNSENFCTVVQLNIQLAVNITSIPGIPLLPIIPLLQHEMSSADSKSIIIQPQRLTEHSRSLLEINGIPEYPSNQPMYFKATAESSETYISTMSFHRMQVTGSKNSYLLYENGVPTSHGKRMGLQFFKVNTGGGPLEKNSMTKFFKFTPSQAELGSPITLSSVFHVGYGFMNGWKGWSQSNSNLPFSSSSYSFNSQRSAAATRANTAALSPADWQHSSLWMYQNDEAQRTVAQGPNDAGVSEARATLEFALSMQISVGSPLFLLQNLLSTLLAAISIFSIFFFTDIPINVI